VTSTATAEHVGVLRFPAGFVWGAATAAYQIEGATREDGRGPSIWDTFCGTPGKVFAGDTGDVACDHYHRYADDVALMADLGLACYRFSVAWPRIQPDGSGPVEERGIGFYDRLVDELCERGIKSFATLYHWDLPQALEDRGGWPERDVAARFADYAATVYSHLGDRVHTWTTLNEPWCAAFLGYAAGVFAPGRTEPGAAFAAAHHLLLGHGLATQALRAAGADHVSLTLNLSPVVGDGRAVALVDGLLNRFFLDPVLLGHYPADIVEHAGRYADLSFMRSEDAATISAPIDLLGINYYNPTVVADLAGSPGEPAYPGSEGIGFLPTTGPTTAMGWPIEPAGLTAILERVARDYPGMPLMITENGAAFDDRLTAGQVHDPDRVAYLDSHLRAAHEAIARGVDLRGYLVWSLLDNFEWAKGYSKRFGIVYVDYASQQRTAKDSARWYREVIRNNGLGGA
jgi:beta-glucosidase